ncbi:phage head spike fiber domain-containing protein [Aeromonas sp. QDB04]|uniref:phage head spike fiber domain-containing protein n=1 Tax=Aeromonas sp. QDB04 TaxID=2990477 RepID=UPI0022E5F7EE|nr:hypothetical protein [Aeromonas sp. QDB04]
MTTTAAGDAAVARLNKATEAFEKIITGASNQVVDVPGYGNQPTLAARVDERLDETTATAAAEADRSRDEADRATTQATAAANSVTLATAEYNKAKTQADRAQSEADRAAQITGLEDVSDAVALAALPLPDVWAPLSDSLRLITGYGRDVLVGSDVVARMVNYWRSSTATYIGKDGLLKTAAANEPRFEKEGLLIEGQSTNLWPSQTAVDSLNAAPASTSLPDGTTGNIYKITPTPGAFAYVRKNFAAQSGNHTLSCYAKLDNGSMAMPSLYCGSNGSYFTKLTGVYVGNGWWRMQAALLDPFGNIGFGYHFAATETTPVWVCNFQLEALPFASSYIPTAGAAATRAVDQATLPQSLNLGESQLGFSLAVEFDSVNTGGGRLLELSDQSSIILDGASLIVRHVGREVYGINAPLGQRHHLAYSVAADGALTVALNGKLLAPQSRSGSYPSSKSTIALGNRIVTIDRTIYGHLRDLKIWTKKPLTADQLKVASA